MLFRKFGVELEYMLVDTGNLDVLPVADRLLADAAGEGASDYENGPITWSNELVNHVLEFKTTEPATEFAGLAASFQANVREANQRLEKLDGLLLPTAMHPWMDPAREMRLWPNENSEVYQAFHRIFDCRGHGWANLQSMHLNLPFEGDDEFGRLHAAIRAVLPILPALAASSPLVEGKLTGLADNRLEFYRKNSAKIPRVAGRVIPEPVYTAESYDREIFQPMYAQIAPFDPEGILQEEWLNARGAIARFDRGAIEIRVLDVQECPAADLAIAAVVLATVRRLMDGGDLERLKRLTVDQLEPIFRETLAEGDLAAIDDPEYLSCLGFASESDVLVGEVWGRLSSVALSAGTMPAELAGPLKTILEHGPLARRITGSVAHNPSPSGILRVYHRLADCLAQGEMFVP